MADKHPELNSELTFHHTGIAVESIAQSLEHYSQIFGEQNVSEPVFISSQKVNVCFVKVGPESFIELVEPTDEDSVIAKMVKKRVTYYHVAYKVNNITKAVEKLESMNYKALEPFKSEAFDGKYCVFLYSPEAYLIELIEK